MPHGRHIYAKSFHMANTKKRAYSQSDHALPNWKCVMRYCYKCPSIDLPDQETYDQYPNTSFSISFKIYDLITRCKTHVRLPLTNNKICRKCKENTVTEQSTKIYTRKELLMTDTTF